MAPFTRDGYATEMFHASIPQFRPLWCALGYALLLGACSKETEDDDGCPAFCDYVVACTPNWVEEDGEVNCSWKYGKDEAYDRCASLCGPSHIGIEDVSDQEMKECLQCVVTAAGDSCPTLEISHDCPCIFDTVNYAEEAVPSIEPLTCDSGDVYPYAVNVESGEYARERCLDGERNYCR